MMKTIRHEGFHQYFDRLVPDPPVWLNEGLAVYFEEIVRSGGTAQMQRPRFDQLQILADGKLEPVAPFLHITPHDFYANAPHTYGQAWLLVHMLRHGSAAQRALFTRLLARLETQGGAEAVDATFDDAALETIDTDLSLYLQALRNKK